MAWSNTNGIGKRRMQIFLDAVLAADRRFLALLGQGDHDTVAATLNASSCEAEPG